MRPSLHAWLLPLVASFLVGLAGCDRDGNVVRREGQPDLTMVDENDAEMDRAVAKARATYRELVQDLSRPSDQHHGHAVKKAFPTSDGGLEHIWINELTWDGNAYHGVINNDPVNTKAVASGDRVTVTPEELSDWMYLDGNRIVGGYTLRVLHHRSSPQQQREFVEQTGLVVPPVDF